MYHLLGGKKAYKVLVGKSDVMRPFEDISIDRKIVKNKS
jgi:hypothetical protein